MNLHKLLENNKLDDDDIKYAVDLTAKKYIAVCLKKNKVKDAKLLKEIILKEVFDKINLICVISRITDKELLKYINKADAFINIEFIKMYNQIERNLGGDSEWF